MSLNGRPVLALIPARSGSKGLRGKNMCKVNEVPLVGYSIQAALDSNFICDVYLTSDDELTLSYAEKVGVIPLRRPAKYSTDLASANDVVEHFLKTLPESLLKQDPYIIYLQPTSPLRTTKHIDDALDKMLEQGLNKLISVVEMTKSPFKSFVLDKQGCLQSLFDESKTNQRRQDLPAVYAANGAIYVFCLSDFTDSNTFPSNGSYPYIMSEVDSLDIDVEDDLDTFQEIINKKVI
ncbi:MAG: CMP-N,N'-diacetyllegionaminic acid synthase [Paraglaciecola sp.]|jgi:CMP-N,N'-diacetyllegionaminic acid synthase